MVLEEDAVTDLVVGQAEAQTGDSAILHEDHRVSAVDAAASHLDWPPLVDSLDGPCSPPDHSTRLVVLQAHVRSQADDDRHYQHRLEIDAELTNSRQIYCRGGRSPAPHNLPSVAAGMVHKLDDVGKLAPIVVGRMRRPTVVVVQIPDVVVAMDLEELQRTAADRVTKGRPAALVFERRAAVLEFPQTSPDDNVDRQSQFLPSRVINSLDAI